jgi:hypothetical protein
VFWSKDIVVLFPSRGSLGVKVWAEYYHAGLMNETGTSNNQLISDEDIFFPGVPQPLTALMHVGIFLDLADLTDLTDANTVVAHLRKLRIIIYCLLSF